MYNETMSEIVRLARILSIAVIAPLCWSAEEECVFSEDFEDASKTAWHVNAPLWSFRDGMGRRGSRALVYGRDGQSADVKVDSPYIGIPVQGGERYRIVGYFRGRSDGTRRPKIKFSCSDADGNPACAAETMPYANNALDAGNFDREDVGWTRLEIVTPFLPRKDVSANICVMFPGGFLETAVFDDIRITRVEGAPVTALYSSAYRDRESEGPVTFIAQCNARPDVRMDAELSFRGVSGGIVRRPVALDAEDEFFRATVDVGEMAKGANDVVLSVIGPDGKALASATNRFFRGEAGERRPRVWSDRFGRTIVGGKPFFPVGLESTIRPDGDILEHYASGPFNCIRTLDVPTLDQLDKYHARGIMWIAGLQNYYFNVKRASGGSRFRSEEDVRRELRRIITTYKDHPATLAWLTNDELPVGNVPQAEATYRFFRDLDPDHPVRCCLDQPQTIRAFMGSFDNICTDPYPIGGSAKTGIGTAGRWTRTTRQQSFGIRPIWQVVQAFDWAWYRHETPEQKAKSGAHMPTAEEMRSMSWQCIAEGANGLLWYAYNCYHRFTKSAEERDRCWLDVCTVASEVRRHADMMLSVEPAPAAKCDDRRVLFRVWRYEGNVWLLVCNTERTPLKATVSFDGAEFAKGVSALGASRFALSGGRLAFELQPIGVSLVRLEPAE